MGGGGGGRADHLPPFQFHKTVLYTCVEQTYKISKKGWGGGNKAGDLKKRVNPSVSCFN